MVMVNVVTIAAYRRVYWLRLIGLVQRSAATWRCMLHSSDELCELSLCLCHDDCTINKNTITLRVSDDSIVFSIIAKFFFVSLWTR